MTTFTEGFEISDVLKREFDPLHNREEVVIASGNNLKTGAVLGKIAASGKYAPYDDNNADGTQAAVAILLEDVDASAADARGVILARGPAVVNDKRLVWAGSVLAAEKITAAADLAALGIVIRTGV